MANVSRALTSATPALLLFMAGVFANSPAAASIVFTAEGTAPLDNTEVSASVEFEISGNHLRVILTNTSAAATNSNGSVLTGVTWSVDSSFSGALSIVVAENPQLSAGSNIYENVAGTSGNQRKVQINNAIALGGSWTNNLTDTSIGDYGVSTTGGDGLFGVSGIVGSGGADYGLVGPNTYPVAAGEILVGNAGPKQLSLIQSSLYFDFVFTDTLTPEMILGVNFLFGTAGDYLPGEKLPPPPPAAVPNPEPMTLAIWAGFCGLGLVAVRRRQKAAG